MAFVTTKGFRDVLKIGNQARPNIFELDIHQPEVLYGAVEEIDERVEIVSEEEASQQGTTGEWLRVRSPDWKKVEEQLTSLVQRGFRSLAVGLLHSHTFGEHEIRVGEIARRVGFGHVSLSGQLQPMVRLVPRGHTACVDAYLTPLIREYVDSFEAGFDEGIRNVRVSFMMSDGGLCPTAEFHGFKAILSGPAGGVVGYASGYTDTPLLGFDMGGTSSDVSRFDGALEHTWEATVAGVPLQAPQVAIETVAAGGGSLLTWESGVFRVGPASAGAHPGPACYRKGGPLALTDANVVLGRLLPDFFPHIFGPNENESLDVNASRAAMAQVTDVINQDRAGMPPLSVEEVALGFVRVANEHMSRPMRSLTEAKGWADRKSVV